MTRSFVAALAVLTCLLASPPAQASDPLPVEFGGGFLPPTPYFKEGTSKISVAMVKNLRDVSKCYRRAVSDAFRFKPDNLPNCLAKASQRLADAKTFLTLRGYVPLCTDMSAMSATLSAMVAASAPQTWCDATSGIALPASFGGGWLPTDSFRLRGTSALQKNLVEYFAGLSSCYRKGVLSLSIGQPDGVVACVQSALARYNERMFRVEQLLPVCDQVAWVNIGLAWASQARALNPIIYCAN